MSIRKLFTYFKSVYNISHTTNGWYAFSCPFCRKRDKRAVHFQLGITKCWTCDSRMAIYDFIMAAEDCTYAQAKKLVESCEESLFDKYVDYAEFKQTILPSLVTLPEGFTPILEGDNILGKRARNYLTGRGFDLEYMDRQGFGYCREHAKEFTEDFYGYIIVPFKQDGRLCYYLGRNYMAPEPRYKNPPKDFVGVGKADMIFNEDALLLEDTVFIMEGWADAATMGPQGTSTQGWSMSHIQRHKYMSSTAKRLVFVPDAGYHTTGHSYYKTALRLAYDFIHTGKDIHVLSLGSGAGGKDANEIGKETILRMLAESKPIDFTGVLKALMR